MWFEELKNKSFDKVVNEPLDAGVPIFFQIILNLNGNGIKVLFLFS